MKRFFQGASTAAALLVLIGSGCGVESGSLVGKGCDTAADCPPELVCVYARTGPMRTCEVLSGPEHGDTAPRVTGPVYWCDGGVSEIMNKHCVSCHSGTTQSFPGFRLDTYEDADGLQGAKSKMDRIKAKMLDTPSMPPTYIEVRPTSDELAQVRAWIAADGPLCAP